MSVLGTSKNPGLKKELFDFTNGIEVDAHLCTQEIKVQKAWAESLAQISLLSLDDLKSLNVVLDEAQSLMLGGTFPWRVEDEDIHMNLERFVTEKLGELGKRLHLGRSRNDLIATTLRLFINDSLKEFSALLSQVIRTVCQKAKETSEIIVPGTTHLQNAQPIRFGHVLAAYGWSFLRDKEKSKAAQKLSLQYMPLGSAALAGTTVNVNLGDLAQRLGFEAPTNNSYDAVGDRDFILSALETFSGAALHLSRLSEDIIYWASTSVGLVKLPKNWSTGSSIMPNKRNPDVPELIRAKASHIIASQTNAYLLMKALPSSYDSDLHELKSVFLKSFSEIQDCLAILVPFLSELEVNKERALELLSSGHLLATEIANHLTSQGVTFREAYAQTAALVELAESEGVSVEKLNPEHLMKVAPQVDPAWVQKLSFENAVEKRNLRGGTSLKMVLQGINTLESQNNL